LNNCTIEKSWSENACDCIVYCTVYIRAFKSLWNYICTVILYIYLFKIPSIAVESDFLIIVYIICTFKHNLYITVNKYIYIKWYIRLNNQLCKLQIVGELDGGAGGIIKNRFGHWSRELWIVSVLNVGIRLRHVWCWHQHHMWECQKMIDNLFNYYIILIKYYSRERWSCYKRTFSG